MPIFLAGDFFQVFERTQFYSMSICTHGHAKTRAAKAQSNVNMQSEQFVPMPQFGQGALSAVAITCCGAEPPASDSVSGLRVRLARAGIKADRPFMATYLPHLDRLTTIEAGHFGQKIKA